MLDSLSRPYIKYPLLIIYIILLGFSTGFGLLWGLPLMGLVPGVILSYGLGLLLGCAIVYVIFSRWHASRRTKLLVAIVVLVAFVAAGLLVANQGIIQEKQRVIELLK